MRKPDYKTIIGHLNELLCRLELEDFSTGEEDLALAAAIHALTVEVNPRNDIRGINMYLELEPRYLKLRQDLRQLLSDHGVPSNPGWTDDDIVRSFRELLTELEGDDGVRKALRG
jgi:hypothetical protein